MADGKFTGFIPGMARSPSATSILGSYDEDRRPSARSDAPSMGRPRPLLDSRGTR
jgi:hypothetical protein